MSSNEENTEKQPETEIHQTSGGVRDGIETSGTQPAPAVTEENIAENQFETEVHQASGEVRDDMETSGTQSALVVTEENIAENQLSSETGFQSGRRESDDMETTVNDPARVEEYTINKTLDEAKLKYEFFWEREDVFSQWHKSAFMVDGKNFSCAEQYMMYMKAVLLHDDTLAQKILKCTDPKRMKSLGRKTKQFSEDLWLHNCLHVVKEGNIAKFSQNEDLKKKLFDTYPRVLVEASPFDKVWGIGISVYEECAWNEATWEGKNLLGFILTEVRDELMCKDGFIKEIKKQVYFDKLMDDLKKTSFGRRHSYDRHWRTQVPENNVNKYNKYEEHIEKPEGIDTTGAARCSVSETGPSTESNLYIKPGEENTDYQNELRSSIKSCEGTFSSHERDCKNNDTIPGAEGGLAVELTPEEKEENESPTNSKTYSGNNMQHDKPCEEEIERQ